MRNRSVIVVWAIVVLAALAGLTALYPSYGEICEQGQQAQNKECTSYGMTAFLFIKVGKALDAMAAAITALATVVMGWFTYTLSKSTDKMWVASKDQIAIAQKAAEAAEFNTRVFVNSERAFIIITATLGTVHHPAVECKISNIGRTPGTVKEYRAEVFFGTRDNIPAVPTFTYSKIRKVEIVVGSMRDQAIPTVRLNRNPFWERATDDPVAIFTLALVAFTFVLAGSTINQTSDTRVVQRAYVGVIPLGIVPFRTDEGSDEGRIACHVAFVNSGNLPAQNVSWILRRKFSTVKRLSHFPIEGRFYGNNVIVQNTKGAIPLTKARYVEYRDTFDRPHKSRFAYKFDMADGQSIFFFPDGPDSYWEYS